jgi:DNA repair exonuclease SbcCD ATPase subunit
VLILDEPFRYLSTDLQSKASEMLNEISERLGLQIIMVTHEEELVDEVDKTFRVRINKGKSTVEEAG